MLKIRPAKAYPSVKKDLFSENDCYIILTLGTQTFRTPTKQNSAVPCWTQQYEFHPESGNVLQISIYDEDEVADDFIGGGVIDLTRYFHNNMSGKQTIKINNKGKPAGKIDIQIKSNNLPQRMGEVRLYSALPNTNQKQRGQLKLYDPKKHYKYVYDAQQNASIQPAKTQPHLANPRLSNNFQQNQPYRTSHPPQANISPINIQSKLQQPTYLSPYKNNNVHQANIAAYNSNIKVGNTNYSNIYQLTPKNLNQNRYISQAKTNQTQMKSFSNYNGNRWTTNGFRQPQFNNHRVDYHGIPNINHNSKILVTVTPNYHQNHIYQQPRPTNVIINNRVMSPANIVHNNRPRYSFQNMPTNPSPNNYQIQ